MVRYVHCKWKIENYKSVWWGLCSKGEYMNTYFFIHLQFLEKDFLEDYLGQLEMEVEHMENVSQTEKNWLLLSKQTIMEWKITSKRILDKMFILSLYNYKVWCCTYNCKIQHFATFQKWNLLQNARKAACINLILRESFQTMMIYLQRLQ